MKSNEELGQEVFTEERKDEKQNLFLGNVITSELDQKYFNTLVKILNLVPNIKEIDKDEFMRKYTSSDLIVDKEKAVQYILDSIGMKRKEFDLYLEEEIESEEDIKDLSTWIKLGVPKIEYRIDKFLTKKGICFLGGTSGTSKTWLAMQLALSVAGGTTFFGNETEKCNVLYLDEENGATTIINRFDRLIKGKNLDNKEFKNLFISFFSDMKLDTETTTVILRELIIKYDAKVVILDSLVRMMIGVEDKSEDCRRIFDNLKPLMKEFPELCFILLHHTTKQTSKYMVSLRGSGDLAAFSDWVYMFTEKKGGVVLNCVKSRFISKEESINLMFKVIDDESNGGINLIQMEDEEQQNQVDSCANEIKDWVDSEKLNGFISKLVCDSMTKLGFKKNVVYLALNILIVDKFIIKSKRGVYKVENPLFTGEQEELV